MGKRDVLVIGAGVSGITSALELANTGSSVYLIEKEAAIGGYAASFCCKATDICSQCSVCIVPEKINEAAIHPKISLLTNSTVQRINGEVGDFHVEELKSLNILMQQDV